MVLTSKDVRLPNKEGFKRHIIQLQTPTEYNKAAQRSSSLLTPFVEPLQSFTTR